jgi:hypothetical protein
VQYHLTIELVVFRRVRDQLRTFLKSFAANRIARIVNFAIRLCRSIPSIAVSPYTPALVPHERNYGSVAMAGGGLIR